MALTFRCDFINIIMSKTRINLDNKNVTQVKDFVMRV